ncbi:MAG: hypothetical protein AAF664_20025 [Planctomycetota bacterium]
MTYFKRRTIIVLAGVGSLLGWFAVSHLVWPAWQPQLSISGVQFERSAGIIPSKETLKFEVTNHEDVEVFLPVIPPREIEDRLFAQGTSLERLGLYPVLTEVPLETRLRIVHYTISRLGRMHGYGTSSWLLGIKPSQTRKFWIESNDSLSSGTLSVHVVDANNRSGSWKMKLDF